MKAYRKLLVYQQTYKYYIENCIHKCSHEKKRKKKQQN